MLALLMEMDHRGFHLSIKKNKLASLSKLGFKFSDARGEANELRFVSPILATPKPIFFQPKSSVRFHIFFSLTSL